jgi:hypothetical protein
MADSCRTSRKGRKGRTKSDDATLSRGSSAKASATVRALRNPPGRAARNRRLLYCCSLVAVGRFPDPVSAGRERTRLRPRLA